MYNKYGEEKFIVEILEYVNTSNEVELKMLEQNYQKKDPNCISLDSNEIFTVQRSEEWRLKQSKQLNEIRELGLRNWRVPIIVYNIEDKTHKYFNQLSDAEELMEQKHIYKNIKDKILTPYKNKYVAFKKEDFTEENIKKIISVNTNSYASNRNLCTLYDLLENKEYHYSSKRQFSLHFSKSPNNTLFDTYKNNNLLDFYFKTTSKVINKAHLYNLNINLRTRLSKTRCNFKIWYNALYTSKTNKEIVEKTGINRTTLNDIFNDRSKSEWLVLMTSILSQLPD